MYRLAILYGLFVGYGLIADPLGTTVQCNGLAIQSNNKIVTAGKVIINDLGHICISRYNSNGSLDNSFGSNGTVTTLLGAGCEANGIALDSGENIIITGYADDKVVIARYTPSGVLDPTFGVNGIVVTLVTGGAIGNDLVIDTINSKIIIVGSSGITNRVMLLRCDFNGNFDTAFGNNGVVITHIGSRSVGRAVSLQLDGKIVVGGCSTIGASGVVQSFVARYNSDGSLDTSFGIQGIVTYAQGAVTSINDIAIKADGAIVASGFSGSSLVVWQYVSNGTLDTNFATNGIYTYASPALKSIGNSLGIQADAKIVIVGGLGTSILALRLLPNGTLDATFGNAGMVSIPLQSEAEVTSCVIRADQKILACGGICGNALIIQLATDGSLDGVAAIPSGSTFIATAAHALVWDKKATGTNGGSFAADTWQTRTLNTFLGDQGFIELSNNQFTLQPGRYALIASAPAYRVNQHQIRLFNVTDSKVAAYGTSEGTYDSTTTSPTRSLLQYSLWLDTAKIFELQHRCATTFNGAGFGIASGFPGNDEVYSQVHIIRLA